MRPSEPSPAARYLAAVALRACPREVRARFGDELAHTVEETWAAESATRNRAGRALLLARLTADAVMSGLAFRVGAEPALRERVASRRSGGPVMAAFLYDARLATRSLLAARAFAATAVSILALGIGGMTAVVSLVHHVLVSPLPYPEPHRLVMVWDVLRSEPSEYQVASPGNIADWIEQSTAFAGLAAFNLSSLTLDFEEGRERVPGAVVTANYFDVLGVRPQHGRGFTADDDTPGAEPVLVLSHGFWRRRFGADPGIVGGAVRIGARDVRVVGVMPPDFRGPDEHHFGRADFWLPMRMQFREAGRGGHYLRTVGRLKPGVSLEQAKDEIRRIADRASAEYPDTNRNWTATVVPLHDAIVAGVRPALLLLLAAVALVHLIVCANLANLLLSRGVTREREYAIRSAIGASRGRIIQITLAESAALTLMGSLGGIVLAGWLLRVAPALVPDLPRADSLWLDVPAAGFAVLFALATSVIAALVPAILASRTAPVRALQAAGRGSGTGRQRARRILVVSEIAVSVVLLVGALLLTRSFARLASVPSGFSTAGVLTAQVGLPPSPGTQGEANREAAGALAAAIESLPGVQDAGFTTSLPLHGLNNLGFTVETRTRTEGERRVQVRYRAVTPGYLRAIGVDLRTGRLFDDRDREGAPGAVVLNDVAARAFGAEGPIGAPIRLDFGGQVFEGVVVGVIGGIRHEDLTTSPEAELYVPYAQHPVMGTLFLTARSAGPLPGADALRQVARRASPRATLDGVQPLQTLVDRALASQRLNAVLLTGLSSVALALSLVGLYAVISHGVALRAREFGIRLALGAQPARLVALVLNEGLVLAAVGVALGGLVAYLGGGLLEGMLFGIGEHDAATFVMAIAIMAGVAAAASYLPARRASRVDPIVSLRVE